MDLGEMLRESPPWLVSAIVHMLAMIIFGLMIVHAKNNHDLLLDAGYSEDFGDPIAEDIRHLAERSSKSTTTCSRPTTCRSSTTRWRRPMSPRSRPTR